MKKANWSEYKTVQKAEITTLLCKSFKGRDIEIFNEALMEFVYYYQIKRTNSHLKRLFGGKKWD